MPTRSVAVPASRETATLVRVALPEPLELLHATYVRHRFAPHTHDTFVLAVVESGAASSRYRGGVALYRPGGVVVVEPGEPHDGEPAPGGWRYRALYPAPALLARLAGTEPLADACARADAQHPGARRLFASSFLPDAPLAARLAAAHAALASAARGDTLRGEVLLAEALCALLRRHACATAAIRSGIDALATSRGVHAARALLHDAFAQPLSLAELADAAHLPPARLTRAFRLTVGLPPHAYLELVRVEQAKLRLRRGDPIADVAFATGFADQSHLTRRFRRVVGVTPGVYARACAASRAGRRVA
jgi:AraC-like DNA-binding protein